jgi:hypothetical protein
MRVEGGFRPRACGPSATRSGGRDRRRGAAAVELAVVLPLFLLVVLGMIESSRLGMVAQSLTSAAREGCRVAVIDGKTAADVQDRVCEVLHAAGITTETSVLSPSDPASAELGEPVTLTLSVPFRDVSWLPAPFFFESATITASATMSSERP